MPATVLPGLGTQAGSGAYGAVPTVPDPLSTQAAAVQGNTNILSNLLGLSQGMGAASAAGANQQLINNLPGYQPLTAQASGNIMSDLQGQIAPDVMAMLNQQAAQRGVSFDPSSPNTNAAALRAMGLTSTGLEQQGQQELTAAIARTPTGPQFNPSTMLVTPEEQQGWQYLANTLGAAPNPATAAQANQAALLAATRAGAAGGGGVSGASTTGVAPMAPGTTGYGAGAGTLTGAGTAAGLAAPAAGLAGTYASPTGGTVNTGWSPGGTLDYNLPATTATGGILGTGTVGTGENPITAGLGPIDPTAGGAESALNTLASGITPTGATGLDAWQQQQQQDFLNSVLGTTSPMTTNTSGLDLGQTLGYNMPTTQAGQPTGSANWTDADWQQWLDDISAGSEP